MNFKCFIERGGAEISCPPSGMMSVGVGSNASGAEGDSVEPESAPPSADVIRGPVTLLSQVMADEDVECPQQPGETDGIDRQIA